MNRKHDDERDDWDEDPLRPQKNKSDNWDEKNGLDEDELEEFELEDEYDLEEYEEEDDEPKFKPKQHNRRRRSRGDSNEEESR